MIGSVIPLRDNVPVRRFSVVTAAIIAINAAVWLGYELPNVDRAVGELGFYPCAVDASCRAPGESWPLSLLTAMFTHAGWLHIAGNMLFLWIFGNNVEDAIGRVRYGLFYLSAGVVAMASQTFVTLAFGTPEDARIPNIGASGAIAGVLGAYLVLYPRARVRSVLFIFLFFTLVEVPAVAFLGVWFLFQLWQGGFGLVSPAAAGGVAFFAHIGGFLFGVVAAWLVFRRVRWERERASYIPRSLAGSRVGG
jgi:membrane associated rhomboid family serine protease